MSKRYHALPGNKNAARVARRFDFHFERFVAYQP
jgi:hypothetical protein